MYTFHLVKELSWLERSKKHTFFLLTDQDEQKIGAILGKLPQNFKIFKITPTQKLFWTFYSLPHFLKKNPVDVLHVQYIVPLQLTRKIKIVTTVHDISFRVNPKWIAKKDSIIMNNFIPLSLKRADAVITVSNFSKSEITRLYNYPQNNIFVTYPSVDNRLFSREITAETKKKISQIVGGESPYIFHISSLQPRKNVPLVLKAFSQLKQQWKKEKSSWKDTRLLLVGDKNGHNYDQNINTVIQDLGLKQSVIMPGYLPAEMLPTIFQKALLFVFPSSYEGFGIPILESMISKTPVLLSNIGVFREVAGEAALYVDIDRVNAVGKLAQAMKELAENKIIRDEQVKLGVERAKLFSWEKTAKKTLEIYEKIADQRK